MQRRLDRLRAIAHGPLRRLRWATAWRAAIHAGGSESGEPQVRLQRLQNQGAVVIFNTIVSIILITELCNIEYKIK